MEALVSCWQRSQEENTAQMVHAIDSLARTHQKPPVVTPGCLSAITREHDGDVFCARACNELGVAVCPLLLNRSLVEGLLRS